MKALSKALLPILGLSMMSQPNRANDTPQLNTKNLTINGGPKKKYGKYKPNQFKKLKNRKN